MADRPGLGARMQPRGSPLPAQKAMTFMPRPWKREDKRSTCYPEHPTNRHKRQWDFSRYQPVGCCVQELPMYHQRFLSTGARAVAWGGLPVDGNVAGDVKGRAEVDVSADVEDDN